MEGPGSLRNKSGGPRHMRAPPGSATYGNKWKWVSQQLLITERMLLFLQIVLLIDLDCEQKNEILNGNE